METVDDEITRRRDRLHRPGQKAGKPFFVWWNSTRMHIWTHLKPESRGQDRLGIYPDGMVEHDGHVGRLLEKLDDLGIADNTIVMYSTDNGAEEMTWPDGGTTPFRGEKATNWEGGFRVPCLIRWPGVIEPGTISNAIGSHEDCLPTFLAGRCHPRGLAPPPQEFFFWTDDGDLAALRFNNWKVHFAGAARRRASRYWQEPFVRCACRRS